MVDRAYKRLRLVTPTIRLAPQPPLKTYVGLETWLWIDESDWESRSISVKAGPIRVSMTAEPVGLDWDLTEGTTSCESPGRPWVKDMSSTAVTDCSYTFSTVSQDQPDGKFSVEAAIVYRITWTCNGRCTGDGGDFGEVAGPTSSGAIEVAERQSVVKQ